MPSVPRIYCDSSIFVALIADEPGRASDVQQILEDAEAGRVQLLTSTISVTEVAKAIGEAQSRSLDPEVERRIDALWDPPSPVVVVEFHMALARAARKMMRDLIPMGLGLKPFDAIHLATAKAHDVERVVSYDTKWPTFGEHLGLRAGPLVIDQARLDFPPPPSP